VGISTLNPRAPHNAAIGTGAVIWAGVTLLVALFVGGWASTRLSLLWERTTAVFEGALVWVLSMILIFYLTANGIGLVASGTLGVLTLATQEPARASAEMQNGAGQFAPDQSEDSEDSALAAQAKSEFSATAWSTFASLLLSLLAAISGAAVGRRGVMWRVSIGGARVGRPGSSTS
jgi:hypothetical protein